MADYGRYGRYSGRKPSGLHTFLKGLVLALAILLVILAGAMFFLQDYLVYGDGGVSLQLPWGRDDEPSPSPSENPASTPPILITDDDGDEEEPTEPVPEVEEPLHAVLVSQTALLAGTAADQAAAAGGNAVVVSMKNDDGTLNYVSDVELAISAGASGADRTVNTAIRALTAGEMHTIARVSCFRDHLLPTYDISTALLTNSGYRWDDLEDVRWTSPASQAVRGYLTALCVELAELGFDEILLTNCGYPPASAGHLSWIRWGQDIYPAGALDTVILPFLEQVRAALEPYGVKLSVVGAGAELMGETADTGLNMANVLAACDRLWVEAEDAAAYGSFAAAGEGTDPAEILVPIVDAPGQEDAPWAVLD